LFLVKGADGAEARARPDLHGLESGQILAAWNLSSTLKTRSTWRCTGMNDSAMLPSLRILIRLNP
jgi:hypothetical protein